MVIREAVHAQREPKHHRERRGMDMDLNLPNLKSDLQLSIKQTVLGCLVDMFAFLLDISRFLDSFRLRILLIPINLTVAPPCGSASSPIAARQPQSEV
jgi:hypothetical protein